MFEHLKRRSAEGAERRRGEDLLVARTGAMRTHNSSRKCRSIRMAHANRKREEKRAGGSGHTGDVSGQMENHATFAGRPCTEHENSARSWRQRQGHTSVTSTTSAKRTTRARQSQERRARPCRRDAHPKVKQWRQTVFRRSTSRRSLGRSTLRARRGVAVWRQRSEHSGFPGWQHLIRAARMPRARARRAHAPPFIATRTRGIP